MLQFFTLLSFFFFFCPVYWEGKSKLFAEKASVDTQPAQSNKGSRSQILLGMTRAIKALMASIQPGTS